MALWGSCGHYCVASIYYSLCAISLESVHVELVAIVFEEFFVIGIISIVFYSKPFNYIEEGCGDF